MKSSKSFFALGWAILLVVIIPSVFAQRERPPVPTPTHANVSYGEHPNQVIDFWQAEVGNSGPLVVFIHGGGFTGGSKDSISAANIKTLTEAGIHVASVEYRFLKHAKLPAAHEDAVRAIQFIRSKARDWKIDKNQIGAYGGSAGAQLVAYLAWHDDMADPKSEDPISRESTRLAAVAPLNGQATMDLDWWKENIPGYDEPHRQPEEYSDLSGIAREALVKEVSIINHISADDPPVFMRYGMRPDDQIPEENPSGWKVHHVNFGIAMEAKLRAAGVEATLKYPGPETRYENEADFFIDKLLWKGERDKYSDFEAHTFKGSSGESLHYQMLKPRNFNLKKKYPLVVFLHGSGGRGPANIRNVVDASVPAQLASDDVYGKYDAFYLVPQCPGPNTWAKAEWMDSRPNARPSVQDTLYELIDSSIVENNIDTHRLYVTGLSMGGFGTFSAVSARPDFWAAAVPVCGGWDPVEADVLKGTPMRVFHGDEDKAVDVQYSRDMFAAIKTAGGDIEYTEYPGVGHNSWLKAYWDKDMWKWMFKQKR
ncbi:MAG: alpha/beta hydrolase fold domain-containing protein [Verrucomicrobia bacterium]|nr:alpha/beta hydrolase fold domain-containing protein [Verrucomicrobiota bacterium]MDA1069474.1 alpha/beta hydrolase fold domain-containing protein [Verrucomicrobiota bacterium]